MSGQDDDKGPEDRQKPRDRPEKASRRDLLSGLGLAGLAAALPTAADARSHHHHHARRGAARSLDAALAERIHTVVVIYAENRSFNNLFADFPGLQRPLSQVTPAGYQQRDRDGSILATLPPIWGGLVPNVQVVNHLTYQIGQADIIGLPNRPFSLATAAGDPLPQGVVTRDLVHAFYQNQMQINGGKNDGFVAWGDSGALVMGHYGDNNVNLRLWQIARDYTLCDNFFMGAFGGSFLNHQYLIAARPGFYPRADVSVAKDGIAQLDGDPKGYRLKARPDMTQSAMQGAARFVPSLISPDFYAVNTLQPAYAPTPKPDPANPLFARADDPAVLPPQSHATIGDRLSARGVDWAWYAGGWGEAMAGRGEGDGPPPDYARRPNFQEHHQPFNYFARFAPGSADRERHLRDGGVEDSPRTNRFLAEIAKGDLPAVTFYKPQGNLNMHGGYSDVEAGDRHIANIVHALQSGPQWQTMLVVVTFDENGGWWDHVPPPKGDRWGPGTRIPALVISPHARKGHVDHTFYDTGSIARFLVRRFGLETLPGLVEREHATMAAGCPAPGDLTGALDI